MKGHDPQRSCIGCRLVREKKELLRFVLAPDGTLVPDLMTKLPGRGAYTCVNRSCLLNAANKREFGRAFKTEVTHGDGKMLSDQVASLMEARIGSYLSLANKAGKVVSGSDMVMDIVKRSKAGVIFIATDISPEIGARVSEMAQRHAVPHVTIFAKEQLGAYLGKGLRSVAAIAKGSFIDAVLKEIARYRNFFEGGKDAR